MSTHVSYGHSTSTAVIANRLSLHVQFKLLPLAYPSELGQDGDFNFGIPKGAAL